MMFLPGWLISIATFPGVIVHEMAHLLFCRWRRVAVLEVCYFRFGNPAGYVMHERTEDFTSTFLVSLGPFFINSVLCLLICIPAAIPMRVFDRPDPLTYVVAWLGISIGMHAIPSAQDAQNIWDAAKSAARDWHPLAIVSFPLVVLIYIGNALRFFWFDAIYAIAIGLWLPVFVVERLA
jgi:hypothetical protein